MSTAAALTYKTAGVDIEAADSLVERIKPACAATKRSGVMAGIGGFGALFDLKATGYTDPVLVSSTDGVGTKLRLAIESGLHVTIGQDLVAMSVNDLVTQGAEPLFFLDYFATGKLDTHTAATVIEGIAAACKAAGCALVGGETAEMPDMYQHGDYDLAGFAVGAVERADILPKPDTMKAGDVLIGLPSSGIHSNGYSLVRKVVAKSGLKLTDPAPFAPTQSLAEALLTPTALYVSACLKASRSGKVKGMAHITGGGFEGNVPRILPDGLRAVIHAKSWVMPPVFNWLMATGPVDFAEMTRTFNCGIGMVLVAAAADAGNLCALTGGSVIGELAPHTCGADCVVVA
ncbi:MAG: phosphoribosylformylglycinamidine cyclo-ligase [Proteobacteria bacterium]|nr:phosphoribosylformylglycinamidine cyclo-ligase [Pseudomonadota bacterium]